MIAQVLVYILAAMGLALLFWAFAGATVLPLTPKEGELVLFWLAAGDEAELMRTYQAASFLRESSLAPRRMLLIDTGLTESARAAAQQLAERSQFITLHDPGDLPDWIWENSHGRYTGDPARHCERGDLSK